MGSGWESPPGLLAKFDRMAKTNAATRAAKADKPGTLRRPHTPITEALEAFAQESDPTEDG